MGKYLQRSALIAAAWQLAGCAAIAPVSPPLAAAPRPVMLAASLPSATLADQQMRGAVAQALAARGYVVMAQAPLEMETALAIRAPEVGLNSSPARSDKPLDLCRTRLVRLTVHMLDREHARSAYRGSAEDVFCGTLEPEDFTRLAARALGDLRE